MGADRSAILWDYRTKKGVILKAVDNLHTGDILSVDWYSQDPNIFATGSADQCVTIWDWRMLGGFTFKDPGFFSNALNPVKMLNNYQPLPSRNFFGQRNLTGHSRAVRRVKWSMGRSNTIYSVGYDMTLRVWNTESINPIIGSYDGHTEFVTGVDTCLNNFERVATCAWDQTIRITHPVQRSEHCR